MTRSYAPTLVDTPGPELPAWPLAALFAAFPVWWLLGIGDISWTLVGVVMAFYLVRHGTVTVPRGFGYLLSYLLWVGLSVIAIDTFGRLLGFGFRYAQYISLAIVFVYVYNARKNLSFDRICGYLTAFWCWMIVGGYLGLLFPTTTIRTPLAMVLPGSLLSNDLVQRMAILHLTQGYNPAAWVPGDPRPSAPFLYTNNWGNAFSLLLPIVILYIVRVGPGWRRRLLLLAVPVSMVPAFLTLNRGMFLGLGVAAVVIAIRFALQGKFKAILIMAFVFAVGAVMLTVLPVTDRLDNRLEASGTNTGRTGVYSETIARTLTSPLFGFGGPRPADTSSALPPAGTQGQIWMVMFSHGFIGVALFLAVLVWMIVRAFRWPETPGVVITGVLVALLVEVFYYGILGAGLCITLILGALAMREWPPGSPSPAAIESPALREEPADARSTH